MTEKKKNIPELRFSEFDEAWKKEEFAELVLKINEKYNPISSNEDYMCIELESLDQETGLLLSTFEVSKLKSIKTKFKKNDVLFGKLRPYLKKYYCAEFEGVCSSEIWVFRGKKLQNTFLFYLIQNDKFNYVTNITSGSKMPRADWDLVASSIFLYPSLSEQQKIASFLTSVDERIQQLTKKKELLEKYKKGIMQKIFSQELRFKDDDGKDFPEWEEKRVLDLFRVTRGNVLPMNELSSLPTNEKIFPVYSSQTLRNGLAGYYSNYLFENAITWTTDGANAGDTKYRNGRFYCTNVCGVLISNEGYANNFIAELLNSITRKYVSYVGNPKLMNNVMAQIRITIPSKILEQQKIADFLLSIDKKIEAVEKQLEKTKQFKKGLLQKMFV